MAYRVRCRDKYKCSRLNTEVPTHAEGMKLVKKLGYDKGTGEYKITNNDCRFT